MDEEGFLVFVSEEDIKRERKKAAELSRSQWWKRKRSKGYCHHCGKNFSPRELTMDHLVPVIRGGLSKKGNLVPSCKECNSRKKHHLVFEEKPT